MTAGSVFRRHRRKTLFCLVLVAGIAALKVADVVLGWTPVPPVGLTDTNRFIKLAEYLPSTVSIVTQSVAGDGEQKEFRIELDENGFICPAKIYDAPDFTIAFLGGSTTECMLMDEESRLPHRAGRLLEATHGKVNSYNCGRAGANSIHSLNVLLNKVLPLEPDVITLMHAGNDLLILLYDGTYWTSHPDKSLIGRRVERRDSAWTLTKKLVGRLLPNLSRRVGGLLASPRAPLQPFSHKRRGEGDIDTARLKSEFRKNLQTFIGICRARDAVPVLLTQAHRLTATPDPVIFARLDWLGPVYGIDYAQFRELWRMLNETVREVGRDHDVLVIDLAAKISGEASLMYDLCHYNQQGSERAARIVADELAKLPR